MEGRNKENSQLEERVGFSGLLKKERYERERERERESVMAEPPLTFWSNFERDATGIFAVMFRMKRIITNIFWWTEQKSEPASWFSFLKKNSSFGNIQNLY